MSKRKYENAADDGTVATAGPDAPADKKKPQARQVIDAESGQLRDETKEERFVRLATIRVTTAVKRIRLLETLGNLKQYPHTEEQTEKVLEALVSAVERVRAAFHGVPETKDTFTL